MIHGLKGALVPLPEDGAITTRKRAIPWKTRGGTIVRVDTRCDGKSFPTYQKSSPISVTNLQGSQVTVSENHSSWNKRKKQRLFTDFGGDFSSDRTYVQVLPGQYPVEVNTSLAFPCPGTWSTFRESYSGDLLPTIPDGFPPFAKSGDAELRAWGTKAIAACKPTNPVVDAATFLGELLHEGLPKLPGVQMWKEKTRLAKAAGSEYLNVEFGWEPIARDIDDFAKAVYNAHRVLSQFERDSGRLVRRRFEFKPVETNVLQRTLNNVSPWGNPGPSLFDGSQNKGKVIVTRKTTIARWFSGAFTYYVPQGSTTRDLLGKDIQYAKRLLGIAPTPETVWNLAPWSWAIDWFTNAGDVISNLSSWMVDSLVLKYGYVMEHTVNQDTYVFAGPTGFAGSSARPSIVNVVSETKRRIKATPYGFGLTWTGLSPRQMAIIAALGITRR
jgi:hypothetical protein